jgi:hypothetical protein
MLYRAFDIALQGELPIFCPSVLPSNILTARSTTDATSRLPSQTHPALWSYCQRKKIKAISLVNDAREFSVTLNQQVLVLEKSLDHTTDRLELLSTHDRQIFNERDEALKSLDATNDSYQKLNTDHAALAKRNAEHENEIADTSCCI